MLKEGLEKLSDQLENEKIDRDNFEENRDKELRNMD